MASPLPIMGGRKRKQINELLDSGNETETKIWNMGNLSDSLDEGVHSEPEANETDRLKSTNETKDETAGLTVVNGCKRSLRLLKKSKLQHIEPEFQEQQEPELQEPELQEELELQEEPELQKEQKPEGEFVEWNLLPKKESDISPKTPFDEEVEQLLKLGLLGNTESENDDDVFVPENQADEDYQHPSEYDSNYNSNEDYYDPEALDYFSDYRSLKHKETSTQENSDYDSEKENDTDDDGDLEGFVVPDCLEDTDDEQKENKDRCNRFIRDMTLTQLMSKDEGSSTPDRYQPFVPPDDELLHKRIPLGILESESNLEKFKDPYLERQFKDFYGSKRKNWPKMEFYAQLFRRSIQSCSMMGRSSMETHNRTILCLLASNRIEFTSCHQREICDGCGLKRKATIELIVLDLEGQVTNEMYYYGIECASKARALAELFEALNSVPFLPRTARYVKSAWAYLEKLDSACMTASAGSSRYRIEKEPDDAETL